jgi:hypothetical protein
MLKRKSHISSVTIWIISAIALLEWMGCGKVIFMWCSYIFKNSEHSIEKWTGAATHYEL